MVVVVVVVIAGLDGMGEDDETSVSLPFLFGPLILVASSAKARLSSHSGLLNVFHYYCILDTVYC